MITLPKILFRVAKDYLKVKRQKYPHLREAMLCLQTDWANLTEQVRLRRDHKVLSNAAIQLITTLVQFVHDLGQGIGKFDANLPADDLIKGTQIAVSSCCLLDSSFIGVMSTGNRVKWRMLCPCGKEWHV